MNKDKIKELPVKEIKKARGIKEEIRVLLFARAAGRCELCNELLIKDTVTHVDVIWGQMAHIYAFSGDGPRPNKKHTGNNNIDNLLLACPNCHVKIDKSLQVKNYSVEYLKKMKSDHEARIKLATSFKSGQQTKVLKMIASINNEAVKLCKQDIVGALMTERLLPYEEENEEIDFTQSLGLEGGVYWKSKSQEIDQVLAKFYSDLKREKVEHVSIFGIGPMPLLMYLGSKLENKIKTKLFQRHRDGENWEWKKGNPMAVYQFGLIKRGADKNKVALLLSLSGTIDRKLLPKNSEYCYIYELSLAGDPSYNFLRTEKDLFNFEKYFTTVISKIKNTHPGLKHIDIFPAVPAPVAIVCGRSLNKNSDPKLRIFNSYNKNKFKYSLTIN
jgi:hypothetical protein